jgi:hypothetical protein
VDVARGQGRGGAQFSRRISQTADRFPEGRLQPAARDAAHFPGAADGETGDAGTNEVQCTSPVPYPDWVVGRETIIETDAATQLGPLTGGVRGESSRKISGVMRADIMGFRIARTLP